MDPRSRSLWSAPLFLPAVVLSTLAFASLGRADEITFDGMTITGTVKEISSKGVSFEFGYGPILVPFDQIEALTTDEEVYIVHGDRGGSQGRILGIEGGALLVGESPETAALIPIETIIDMDTLEELESWQERLRNRYRYWNASLGGGAVYTDKTTDELDLSLTWQIERRKKPNRFLLRGSYIYGQDRRDRETTRSDNELRGLIKLERDFSRRWFAFTSHDLENDEIDRISLRWTGAAGPGYRIFDEERYRLQLEAGIGHYYQRNFGDDTNNYWTANFGFEAWARLPLGSTMEARTLYAPSTDDWEDDYVIISEAIWNIPIIHSWSVRWIFQNTYDNTPDPDVQRDEFKTILAVAWNF